MASVGDSVRKSDWEALLAAGDAARSKSVMETEELGKTVAENFTPFDQQQKAALGPAGRTTLSGVAGKEDWQGLLEQADGQRVGAMIDKAVGVGKAASEIPSHLLSGFYRGLQTVAALPADAVIEAVTALGVQRVLHPEWANERNAYGPGAAWRILNDHMEKAGFHQLPRDRWEQFIQNVGQEGFNQLAMQLGMTAVAARAANVPAAAPSLAGGFFGDLGEGIRQTSKQLGETLTKQPVTSTITSLGSAPGIVAGKEAGGFIGETLGGEAGRAMGEMGGSLLAGGVSAAAALSASKKLRLIPGHEMPSGAIPVAKTALADPNADPAATSAWARGQLQKELLAVDNSIDRALAEVMTRARRGDITGMSAGAASDDLVQTINRMEDGARAIERRVWEAIPSTAKVNTGDIRTAITELRRHHQANPDALPDDILTNIMQLSTRRGRGPAVAGPGPAQPTGSLPPGGPTGAPGPTPDRAKPMTVHDLMQARSALLARARRADAAPDGRALAGASRQIADAILDAIETGVGGRAVEQARAFSRELNDRFTRGPIGQALQMARTGETRLNPEAVFEFLLNTRGGLKSYVDIGAPFQTPVGSTGAPAVIRDTGDAAIRAHFHDLVKSALDEGRAFGESGSRSAGTAGAAQAGHRARTIMERLTRQADQFADTQVALNQTTDRLLGAFRQRQAVEKSAMARIAQKDVEKLGSEIFSGQLDPRTLRQMMAKMQSDPDAVAGVRRVAVEELFRRTLQGGSIKQAADALTSQGRFRTTMETVLGPAEFSRLTRMVQNMQAIQEGRPDVISKIGRGGQWLIDMMGHIVGLQGGRIVAKTLNTGAAGSLAMPARLSREIRKNVARWWAERDPVFVLTQAVIDPVFEQQILSRIPSNLPQAAGDVRRAQRLLRRVETTLPSMGKAVESMAKSFAQEEEGE